MTWTAAAIAASTGAQIGATFMQGREAGRAAAFEQEQLRARESRLRTAADQAQAARTEEFNRSIQTIQAFSAQSGRNLSSPTVKALIQATEDSFRRDTATERTNILNEADSARMAAAEAGRRRRSAMWATGLSMLSTAGEGAYRFSATRSGG